MLNYIDLTSDLKNLLKFLLGHGNLVFSGRGCASLTHANSPIFANLCRKTCVRSPKDQKVLCRLCEIPLTPPYMSSSVVHYTGFSHP